MDYFEHLKFALKLYADLGLKLFPINPADKSPYCENGFYEATSDWKTLDEWWQVWPGAAIGTPLGPGYGHFVYDIDPRNGGIASHTRLVEQYGDLPPTWMCNTGGGGHQYYFKYPRRKVPACNGLFPGIDIKSAGGYVILPPSKHPSGNLYMWGTKPNSPMAEAPGWLIDVINERPTRDKSGKSTAKLELGEGDGEDRIYPKGMRETVIISLIGSMNRRGMTEAAMIEAMVAEDEARCRPPLGREEVEKLVRKQTAQYSPDIDSIFGISLSTSDPPGWPTRATLEGVASPNAGRVEELVTSLIGKGTTNILGASWKTGKTFITYRLLLDVLFGKPVFGLFGVPKPLRVLNLQMEMPIHEDERRLRRLAIGAGLDPDQVPEMVKEGRLIHYSRPHFDLTVPAEINRLQSFVFDQGVDLIIIDSIIAAFTSIEVTDNNKVRKLFKDLVLPITTNGPSFLLLHHYRKTSQDNGKGNKPTKADEKSALLGAQAWGAASDKVIGLEGVEPKNRELNPGEQMMQMNFIGSWSPNALKRLTIHMRDDGDGTVIEPIRDDGVVEITRIEQACRDLLLHLKGLEWVPQKECISYLVAHDYSDRIAHRAKDINLQRGHVEAMKEGARILLRFKG